jgi:hypothetical protein
MSSPTVLEQIPPQWRGKAAFVAFHAYEVGLEAGRSQRPSTTDYVLGYSDAEADMAAVQRQAVAMARQSIKYPPFDVLTDLRGDHERAEAQRALLRERRIA